MSNPFNSAIKYLREILFIVGDDRKKLPWIISLFFLSSFLDFAGLGLIGPYITLIINPEYLIESQTGLFLQKLGFSLETKDLIMTIGFSLIVVFLLKAVFIVIIKRIIYYFSFNKQMKLQTYLIQAYQQLPYTLYLARNSAEYIQTINGLVARFIGGVLKNLLFILSEGIVGIVILCFLAWTNGIALALLVLLLAVTMFTYDRFFRRNLKSYGERHAMGSKQVIRGINEGMEGFKEIRILGKAFYFQKMVHNGALEVRDMEVKSTLIGITPRYLLEFILILYLVLFVGVSTFLGHDFSLMGPTLSMFAVAGLRLVPLATTLSSSLISFRYGRYATSSLYKDLQVINNQDAPDHPILFSDVEKTEYFSKLELINLCFHYPNVENLVLDNINLSIKPGDSIGLIGPSGAGKTTLVDVLLGLLDPQSGEIKYNNEAMHDCLDMWHAQVAYLPQEIFLIDDTLRNNVAMGIFKSEIDEDKVYESLLQARLMDLVNQLPDGIDTIIGERGVRFSGGQRQRVALARAFYHGRSVLVMDEATSSLDNKTEQEIVEEIHHLKGRKTLIVIAHRLTTVQHCDRIHRLDQGRIVESGTFEQVIGGNKTVKY